MARKYTKIEGLTDVIRARKAAGETNRAICASYGLSLKQVKGLISRQNRKERMQTAGYVPRPKGRPRKDAASEEIRQHNKLVKLRMQVELLRNFLSEAENLEHGCPGISGNSTSMWETVPIIV